jgi:hypothetical protein
VESVSQLSNHHQDWRRKDKLKEQSLHAEKKLIKEHATFENNMRQKIHVNFFNIDLLGRKQKNARNFWVTLNEEMAIEEIERRLNLAFRDKKEP